MDKDFIFIGISLIYSKTSNSASAATNYRGALKISNFNFIVNAIGRQDITDN